MSKMMNLECEEIKDRPFYGHAHAIYIMATDEDGPVKIGHSADIAQRVMSLQTGNPMPIQVFAMRLVLPKVIPPGPRYNTTRPLKENAVRLEKYIHTEMHKLGLCLMREWFDISCAEALDVLEKSASNISCRAISAKWLSQGESALDPEIGWLRSDLLPKAMDAEAQAAKVNNIGLTFMRKVGNL